MVGTKREFDDGIQLFHYPAQWFEYGFLDAPFIQQQIDRYQDSGDSHPEHYRYMAFRHVLDSHESLDNDALERYIILANMDEDTSMAQSVLVDLLNWSGLTKAQREWISNHPSLHSPSVQRIAIRRKLLHELHERGPEDDLVQRIVDTNDTTVQRALLRHDLSSQQLEKLRDRGATTAIRNEAKTLLQRHNARSSRLPEHSHP